MGLGSLVSPTRQGAPIQVRAVRSPRDLTAFVDLPEKIYKGNPYWVPPLKKEVREMLSDENPFWRHADKELFLALSRGQVVGRCAAIVDSLHNDIHGERCGFFGFFECAKDPEAASRILEAVGRWHDSKGMRLTRGPMSPSMNDECGLLIEGFDDPPTFLMPYNPRYYAALLERSRFYKAKDLYALHEVGHAQLPGGLDRLADRIIRKEDVRIRTPDLGRWDEEFKIIQEIYNDAWERNWGFVPITNEEFRYLVAKIKPISYEDGIRIIEVGGVPAAFGVVLPDVNQALRRLNGTMGLWGSIKFLYYFGKITRARMIALGVKKAFRKRGLDLLLYREGLEMAKRHKVGLEAGWTLEDNHQINQSLGKLGFKPYKRYRIYERPCLVQTPRPSAQNEGL